MGTETNASPGPASPALPVRASGRRLDALIAPEVRSWMRREIEEAGGVETYFIGRLDADCVVEEAEAWAFGNERAVPALMQYAQPGDVVLHNHPSGGLEPSDADLQVAGELGERGVGAYIVNNDVTEARIVVKAPKKDERHTLDVVALRNRLRPGGRIAERLAGYEERPEQVAMIGAVAEAFNRDAVAVIEAGTGVGKSLAYLLPAIEWARDNNEKVVVSTGTINLQEQIVHKDLPTIREISGLEFEAALLKGRGNYLCRRRLGYLVAHPDFFDTGETAQQLDEMRAWAKTTREGCLSDLPFKPDGALWERIASEADNCSRARCPTYRNCFFYDARRRAARAHILVVNHHLLMADLAVRAESGNYTAAAVLPPFHRIVFDEAHHVEPVATEYFGARATRGGMLYALQRLMHSRTGVGALSHLASRVHEGLYTLSPNDRDKILMTLGRELPQMHQELRAAIEEATRTVLDRMESEHDERGGPGTGISGGDAAPREIKRRITRPLRAEEFWTEGVERPLRAILTTARPYFEQLRATAAAIEEHIGDDVNEALPPLLELRSALSRIESAIRALMRFLAENEDECRWIETRRRPGGRPPEVVFCIAPLEASNQIREQILRQFKTVVLTSATLTVRRRFEYFLDRIGARDPAQLGLRGPAADGAVADPDDGPFDDIPPEMLDEAKTDTTEADKTLPTVQARGRLRTLLLDTPFDYERQVFLGVPTDLPDPTDAAFEGALAEFLAPALGHSRGRAFVLFTSYALLGRVHDRLAPGLEGAGCPCLRQGATSRSILLDSFRRDIGSVLFATSSFWEGVDVQGEALSCLALTRLPFRVPGEPIMDARIEALRARGLDPFTHMIVPQAVIRFRQGFGRLIRSRSDRGAVLICDKRILTRPYGRVFLDSLPPSRLTRAPAADIHNALAEFFAEAQ